MRDHHPRSIQSTPVITTTPGLLTPDALMERNTPATGPRLVRPCDVLYNPRLIAPEDLMHPCPLPEVTAIKSLLTILTCAPL